MIGNHGHYGNNWNSVEEAVSGCEAIARLGGMRLENGGHFIRHRCGMSMSVVVRHQAIAIQGPVLTKSRLERTLRVPLQSRVLLSKHPSLVRLAPVVKDNQVNIHFTRQCRRRPLSYRHLIS